MKILTATDADLRPQLRNRHPVPCYVDLWPRATRVQLAPGSHAGARNAKKSNSYYHLGKENVSTSPEATSPPPSFYSMVRRKSCNHRPQHTCTLEPGDFPEPWIPGDCRWPPRSLSSTLPAFEWPFVSLWSQPVNYLTGGENDWAWVWPRPEEVCCHLVPSEKNASRCDYITANLTGEIWKVHVFPFDCVPLSPLHCPKLSASALDAKMEWGGRIISQGSRQWSCRWGNSGYIKISHSAK